MRDQVERLQEGDDSPLHVDGARRPEAIPITIGAGRREYGVEVPDEKERRPRGSLRTGRRGDDDWKRNTAVVRLVVDGHVKTAPPKLSFESLGHPAEIGLVFALRIERRESFEELDRFRFEFLGDRCDGLRSCHGGSLSALPPESPALFQRRAAGTLTRRSQPEVR